MAAEAVVSAVLENLTSIALDEIQKEVRQVINVRGEVDKLRSNFRAIKAVLEDAERQQLEKGKASVRDWLDKLKEVSYDIDDALDEWSTAILKSALEPKPEVCSFVPSPSYCFNRGKSLLKTAHKIQALNGRLDVIANERARYGFEVLSSEKPKRDETTSFINVAEVKGRVKDKERIVDMLLNKGRAEETGSELQMISIVGIGGIGKTTLAKLAFNNEKVKSHFEKKIWVCVSDTFNEMRIAKDILKSVIDSADKDASEKLDRLDKLEDVLQWLKNSIEGKKFLLVLDDVWTEEYGKWDQLTHLLLSNGSQGSKILVTTRMESVARTMGCSMLPLGQLSEEEGWSLFSQIAFCGRSDDDCRNLEEIGRKIANKCKGLPLALKTLGGLMRLKKNKIEWQSVLESELWELKEVEEGLFRPLMFSYVDLPSDLKQCFSYCAIFPKDYVIEKKRLIELWMAQGFLKGTQHRDMESVGEDNFNDLSMRSFFQDFAMDKTGGIIKCKMHDMVHDFAVFLTRGECLVMQRGNSIQGFNGRPRHLFLGDMQKVTPIHPCAENLRTLLIGSNGWNSISRMELLKLFDELKCLRIFNFYAFGIVKFPKLIRKLIHLRHLDLSKIQSLKELPEAVCDLYNLLILDISECRSLKRLPRRIGNLINLLHLRNEGTDGLNFMPKGMEKLTSLRTLNKFVVTRKGAALSDLGSLNHLRGTLTIEGLGIVRDEKEAEKAQLQNKKGLTSLTLRFDPNGLSVNQAYESPRLFLEALKPPSNLETLNIFADKGPLGWVWPRWIMSLTKMKKLRVTGAFKNAEQLPPLGKLPSLELLYLCGMKKVKKVGVEFFGIETSLSPSSSSIVAFPKLKSLTFGEMDEWEEWDYESQGKIMPRLSFLEIFGCPKLKGLPHYILQNIILKELKIGNSLQAFSTRIPQIAYRDVQEEKETEGGPKLRMRNGPSWIPLLTTLKSIEVYNTDIEHLPPLGKLPFLVSLYLYGMKKVKKVGVEFLRIETSLSPSSSSIVAFPNLKSLTFGEMDEWEEWDYGSQGKIMPGLSFLQIFDCPKLKGLPHYILQNTTLKELQIDGSLQAFSTHISRIPTMRVQEEKETKGGQNRRIRNGPSWMPLPTTLKSIEIYNSHTEHLPPLGKLPFLASLKLHKMEKVKKVGVEFLGIETSLSPSSSSIVAFPNLKSLSFWQMFEWEEWDYGSRGEEDITIMPRLSSLEIWTCPKLKALPDYILQNATLQDLEIDGSSDALISNLFKEDYKPHNISPIPNIDVEGEKEIVGHKNPIVRAGPSWIPPLINLKNMAISWSTVEQLPPLGKLPSLESLTLGGMEKVKKVGVEFLGIETSLSPSSSSVVAFPNLKSLTLKYMKEWEEWDYGSRGGEDTIMPRLSSLTINDCRKLKALPDQMLQSTTLQQLKIDVSSDAIISNLFKEDYKPHISPIPSIDMEEEKETVRHRNPIMWAGPSWMPPLTNLKNISISSCTVKQLPPLGKLPSLESLNLSGMKKVKKVGIEFLGIETSLSPSSSSVVAFPNLKSLNFEHMEGWEEWDYGSRGEEDITIMPRLFSLTFYKCPKLKALPNYILQNTTLQQLVITSACPIISKRCKEDYQPFINSIPHSCVYDF